MSLAESPGDSDGGEAQARAYLTGERVRLLAERSRDAVLGVLIGGALIAVVLQRQAARPIVIAWVGSFLLVNGYRVWLSRQLLGGRPAPGPDVLTQFLFFAVVNGLWLAALSIGFFSVVPLESKLALTVLILLAVAGGAATYASYARAYIVFVALAIPSVAYEWGRLGSEQSLIVAVTLVVFGLAMVGFSRYLVHVFERSVLIRFDREAVVVQLRAEQRLNELERRKAEEASASKSRFLANASHDLRQPAQALALYTAVLQRSATTDDQRDLAACIAQTSMALGGLLNNLLDLSRLDAGTVTARFEPVDLQRLVSRLGMESAHIGAERGICVTYTCPPLIVSSDPVLIERTLRNLLHNALKFTKQGSVRIEVFQHRRFVDVHVRDTGCGIPPEFHAQVFDEFFQVENVERDREKGLGLGLSIVSRLARLLNGHVTLSSRLGEGSVFTLSIPNPIPENRAATPRSAPHWGSRVLAGVPVLVIDDDPMVRDALKRLLMQWGASVDAVGGLAEAIPLAAGRHWGLCLCDLRLRGDEDGLTAAVALRVAQPNLPIVFISGDIAPERIELATRSGHPLLHKPVDPEELEKTISHVIAPYAI